MLSALPPAPARRSRGDSGFLAPAGRGRASVLGHYVSGPLIATGRADPETAPRHRGDRVLLARVRHHRRAAAVLRRPRHPGRRPPQVGQRPGRAADRGRPAVPARLLHPVPVGRRLAARELSGNDPNGLPLELLRDHAGDAGAGRRAAARGPRAGRPGLGRPGRPRPAAAARLLRRGERAPTCTRSPTGCTAAAATTGSARRLLLGIGGVRAVRAFCARTGHPAPEVFHTNEGHAGFLGLERIREYVAAGLTFDEALEVGRAGTVFTTHTPVPGGHRPVPARAGPQHFGGDPLLPVDRVLALGAETYPGGDPDVFNMAVHGHAARPAGQRRVAAARPGQPARCSPACGRASTPARCRSARSPTACTRPPGWRPRCWP